MDYIKIIIIIIILLHLYVHVHCTCMYIHITNLAIDKFPQVHNCAISVHHLHESNMYLYIIMLES